MSTINKESTFVEIGFSQINKHGNLVCGDAFLTKMVDGKNRFVTVLSDGLGSGIKASVLSTMTASMALNYRQRLEPVLRSATMIMQTLPVDSKRNISYATFTIVDIDKQGNTEMAEYDNPPFIYFRKGNIIQIEKKSLDIQTDHIQKKIRLSNFKMQEGDRLIFYSDGVNQSGIGQKEYPFGWEQSGIIEFVEEILEKKPQISAHELAQQIVDQSLINDDNKAKDDTTCAVIYMRQPRSLLICSGPPYNKANDKELAEIVRTYNGKKVICGGTTSTIIARELHQEIIINMDVLDFELPPAGTMVGVDLVTEGILTLGSLMELLDHKNLKSVHPDNPANQLYHMILTSDVIDLVIGTRINEAHQDPCLPVELEIRRNVVKRIAQFLEEKYLKKVKITYI